MSNVVELNMVTRLPIPADRVLSAAMEADLKTAVVVGEDKEGNFYFASSIASGPEVVWLLELAKKQLLDMVE